MSKCNYIHICSVYLERERELLFYAYDFERARTLKGIDMRLRDICM